MIRLFGIPNCDTMKKARRWLQERGIAYDFHDYKKQGLDEAQLRAWVAELGWEKLINRQGMMWRKLPVEVRVGPRRCDRRSRRGGPGRPGAPRDW